MSAVHRHRVMPEVLTTKALPCLPANHGSMFRSYCSAPLAWIRLINSHACDVLGQKATGEREQVSLCGVTSSAFGYRGVTSKARQGSKVCSLNATSDILDTTAGELHQQLESLHQEAKDVLARGNSARARLMRLSEAAEQLRLRAALEVKAGREENAVRLLKDKQRVMQALEMSRKRAAALDMLHAKLNEAVTRKETQLIAALSCTRLGSRSVQIGKLDNTKVTIPPDPSIDGETAGPQLIRDAGGQRTAAVAELGEDIAGGNSEVDEDRVVNEPDSAKNSSDLPNPVYSSELKMVEADDRCQTEALQASAEEEPDLLDRKGFHELLYLGDVDITEEEEDPPTYVPSPAVPPEDTEMRNHVEKLMYTLKDVLPGSMNKGQTRCSTALAFFSEELEFQDPFFCFRGIARLQSFLSILAESGAGVNLHEIYYENLVKQRFKRWVYCVVTVTLVEDLGSTLHRLGLLASWTEKHDALMMDLQPSPKGFANTVAGNGRVESGGTFSSDATAPRLARDLRLSGELKFEMDKTGKVSSVNFTWYVMGDENEAQLAEAKLWLSLLLSSRALD